MISLRREIDAADHFVPRFRALLKAFLGVAAMVPKTALPVSSDLADTCKADLERATALLSADEPNAQAIEQAGAAAVSHLETICAATQAAVDERDAALKDVVATAAEAIGSFKGHGERHNSNLTTLAEGFESLTHVQDVNELRRRLRESASKLRECAEEMRRENETALRRFETQVTSLQQRLEAARKDSALDRLTGLGSRREAERFLQTIPQKGAAVCVILFSVEKFQDIAQRHGPIFADKLLRAFAHLLLEQYCDDDQAYRWSPSEFLAVTHASLATCTDRGRHICQTFATSKYYTAEAGPGVPLRAIVALGAAQWTEGQAINDVMRRVQETLDKDRKDVWK
jgi:GGDEF domain-containing protein